MKITQAQALKILRSQGYTDTVDVCKTDSGIRITRRSTDGMRDMMTIDASDGTYQGLDPAGKLWDHGSIGDLPGVCMDGGTLTID